MTASLPARRAYHGTSHLFDETFSVFLLSQNCCYYSLTVQAGSTMQLMRTLELFCVVLNTACAQQRSAFAPGFSKRGFFPTLGESI